MNILLLVTELNSANGICAQSVMRELVSRGHSVYCVTNREKHGALDKAIQYSYVKPRLVYRLLNGSDNRKIAKTIGLLLNKMKLAISYPTWPLISQQYARRIYRAAKLICQKNRIDMIIPIYTQIDTLIAANRIKKEMSDIRYIPYFLDSLSGGYGPKYFPKEWVIRRGIRWEEKLLPLADKIILMESSRLHHEKYSCNEKYYDKFVYLDLPLFQSQTDNQAVTGSILMDADKTNIVYVGSLPTGIRSPEYILKVFEQIKCFNFQLYFIGSENNQFLNDFATKDMRVHVIGRCSHEQALQYVQQATALLNIGNSNMHMTPSKIFEYMSFGKPIISTMPIMNEPSKIYLDKYTCKLFLYEWEEEYESAASDLTDFLSNAKNTKVDVEYLKQIFCLNTPRAFAEAVGEM